MSLPSDVHKRLQRPPVDVKKRTHTNLNYLHGVCFINLKDYVNLFEVLNDTINVIYGSISRDKIMFIYLARRYSIVLASKQARRDRPLLQIKNDSDNVN